MIVLKTINKVSPIVVIKNGDSTFINNALNCLPINFWIIAADKAKKYWLEQLKTQYNRLFNLLYYFIHHR